MQEQLLGHAHALVFLSPDGTPWKEACGNALRLLNRLLVSAVISKVNETGETVAACGLLRGPVTAPR